MIRNNTIKAHIITTLVMPFVTIRMLLKPCLNFTISTWYLHAQVFRSFNLRM
jgi:hypothetical protein